MGEEDKPHVQISIDADEVRRWQVDLVARLVAGGVDVSLAAGAGGSGVAGLDLLFAFDRVFVGRATETPADRVPPPDLRPVVAPPALILDLTGLAGPDPAVPVLRVTCLGLPPLAGAVAALLDAVPPVFEIERLEPGGAARVVARWTVGVEERRNVLIGVSQILARLAHMAAVAVERARGGDVATMLSPPTPDHPAPGPASAPTLFLRSLAARVARRLDRSIRAPADWRVIWRLRDAAAAPLLPEGDPTPFRLLRDDGRRFYADPFPWVRDGRTWLFVEEFPYATGRGVLSVCEIGPDGAATTPKPVIEQDCHLSYPQIFEAEGTLWMVPETSGRRTVELWRAVAFPDRWERHAVLLDDVDVGDATLVRLGETWWMFGCAREPWCSSWDALHVWSAPALTGPWTPLSRGPVEVDVAAARPAGAMIPTADGLFRPVQDSSRDYGCGLALARVDRLDAGGFAETVVKRFATPAPLRGLHTWNRAAAPTGLVEVMDVFCRADDFGPQRRLHLAG